MKTRSPIACALLPEWPIAALHSNAPSNNAPSDNRSSRSLRAAKPPARAVHRGRGSAARLLYCDARCRRRGLRPGQSLASARARLHELESVPYDGDHLERAGQALVTELLELSPRIESDARGAKLGAPPMRLWLDVGRRWAQASPHAQALARRLHAHAPYALGVGPTACVAYAAALRAMSRGPRIVPPDEAQAFLDASPLGVLEFDADDLSTLASLGLRRVGELRAFPPAALASRLGPGARLALDRAWGHDARGPHTPHLADELSVRVTLDDELQEAQALLFLLSPALERLATQLRARDLGVTRLALTLEGDAEAQLEMNLASPSAQASVLLELLRTRLDGLRLRSPVHAFRLSCAQVAPLHPATPSLFERGPGRDPGAREVALGRLRERHGERAVRRASRQEDPRLIERARWVLEGQPRRGEAMPWRRLVPPAALKNGAVTLLGKRRMLLRIGRCERASAPFWEAGVARAELFAWAELEGPVLALLRGDVSDTCDDHWEVVAWVD